MGACEETRCVPTAKCHKQDPCFQIKKMKQEKRCPKCQKLVQKEVGPPGEGCMVKVCVVDMDDPKCRPCLTPKPASCGICQKVKETTAADGCKVKVCIPSDAPECAPPAPCPNKKGKPRCDSCEEVRKVKLWSGCYKEICSPKLARDCEEKKKPKCSACETLDSNWTNAVVARTHANVSHALPLARRSIAEEIDTRNR